MHRIRELALRNQHRNTFGPESMIDYFNSPAFFIKRAADALFSARFGPRDLRHTSLNRAARYRAKAFEAKAGKKVARIKHISW